MYSFVSGQLVSGLLSQVSKLSPLGRTIDSPDGIFQLCLPMLQTVFPDLLRSEQFQLQSSTLSVRLPSSYIYPLSLSLFIKAISRLYMDHISGLLMMLLHIRKVWVFFSEKSKLTQSFLRFWSDLCFLLLGSHRAFRNQILPWTNSVRIECRRWEQSEENRRGSG
jgi:hypothetical protein